MQKGSKKQIRRASLINWCSKCVDNLCTLYTPISAKDKILLDICVAVKAFIFVIEFIEG